jgi:hypothetical protein
VGEGATFVRVFGVFGLVGVMLQKDTVNHTINNKCRRKLYFAWHVVHMCQAAGGVQPLRQTSQAACAGAAVGQRWECGRVPCLEVV